jgi:hypothetical protein
MDFGCLTPILFQGGFAIVPRFISDAQRINIIATIGPASGAGRRRLLSLPIVYELAHSKQLLDLVRPYVPSEPTPIRAIYFNKSPGANWLVSWHQDLTIAVRERIELPGFGPWNTKEGVPHVQPPVVYLEQMLAVRIHLDDADESNGALKVLPGTHNLGRLSAEQIQELRLQREEYLCTAATGDALLMRPLLLHASSRSTSDRPRRVLHIEYAGFKLPGGLEWHEAA